MWKQQDSLDAPTATDVAAELPGDMTEGSRALDDGFKDSNLLLERLRALEVKWTGKLTLLTLLLHLKCVNEVDRNLKVKKNLFILVCRCFAFYQAHWQLVHHIVCGMRKRNSVCIIEYVCKETEAKCCLVLVFEDQTTCKTTCKIIV